MLSLPLLLLASAFASSFYEQPFPETVRNAPTIVRGKIGKSETQWTTLPDGSKHLFTYYDVNVSEGFKGGPSSGAPIRIRELGGSKDGVSLNVSGTADFEKGEDVVVMLGESNAQIDGSYPVIGMMMGKFVLEKDANGKEYLRGPGLGSSTVPGLRNEHSTEKPPQVSLDSLREIIRTQAAEPKPAPADLGQRDVRCSPETRPTRIQRPKFTMKTSYEATTRPNAPREWRPFSVWAPFWVSSRGS